MLMIGSLRPGASRLTLGSLWSCSCPCKAPSERGQAGRGELGVDSKVAMGRAASPTPCTGVHCADILPSLPISTQQVTTIACLLILISLGQGCPASQTALCSASHNSLINYCPREHSGLLWLFKGQLVCCDSEVQGNPDPFYPLDRSHADWLHEKALFTLLQLLRGKKSVPISQRAWRADIQKDQEWWVSLVTQREWSMTWQALVGSGTGWMLGKPTGITPQAQKCFGTLRHNHSS